MSKKAEVLVVGGGLAGSCAALQMAKQGAQVTLVHQNQLTGHTASMVPLALYNPAAALRAKKGWRALECHQALHELLDEVAEFLGSDGFISRNGLLRPCLDEGMAAHFRKSAETEGWPEGWVRWLTPEDLRARFPESEHRWGGLWVAVGMTVETPILLQGLHEMLRDKYGCLVMEKKVADVSEREAGAIIRFEDGSQTDTPKVLIAAGAFARDLAGNEKLKLHAVKGQTVEVAPFLRTDFKPSVSSKGYISLHNNRVEIGSTYEHHFDNFNPTDKSNSYLLKKVPRSFPDYDADDLTVRGSWTGIRVTTPDRMPFTGLLSGRKHTYISTGFGSKGMIFAPYCGILTAQHIIAGTELSREISANRW